MLKKAVSCLAVTAFALTMVITGVNQVKAVPVETEVVLQNFDGCAALADAIANPDKMTGASLVTRGSGKALSVDTDNLVWPDYPDIFIDGTQDFAKAVYLQFYYEACGTTQTGDASNSNMAVTLHQWGDGVETKWVENSEATFKIKPEGASEWSDAGGGWFSKNFKGLIRFPMTSYSGLTWTAIKRVIIKNFNTEPGKTTLIDDIKLIYSTEPPAPPAYTPPASFTPAIKVPADKGTAVQDFNNAANIADTMLNEDKFPTAAFTTVEGTTEKAIVIPTGEGGSKNPVITCSNKDWTNAEYLEFYVKGHGTTADPTDGAYNFGLYVSLHQWTGDDKGNTIKDIWWRQNDVSDLQWSDGEVGRYYTKAAGETKWTEYTEDTGTGSQVWIPKNFEGLVRVPVDHYTNNGKGDANDKTIDLANICDISIWLNGTEKDKGIILDDFKVIKKETAPTSIIATGDDSPKVNEPAGNSITKTTLSLSWNKVTGANAYSVNVFKGSDLVKSLSTKNPYIDINELTAGTEYTIQVISYGEYYEVLAAFSPIKVTTLSQGAQESEPSGNSSDTESTKSGSQPENSNTGDSTMLILLTLLASVSAVGFIAKNRLKAN